MPRKLKLRPWKFKENKTMQLYWLCSPFKDSEKRWTIKAIFTPFSTNLPQIESFKEGKLPFDDYIEPKYYIVDFPWGMLPNLRVGRLYKDGIIEDISPIVTTEYLAITNFQEGSICRAFDIPVQLYDFFSDYQLEKEKIWRFQIEGITYFLPCLEIIRAFFATSKTLTNQLLKPYGLDSLITDKKIENNVLSVTLSHEIPQALIKTESIIHLLWLYLDKTARTCWERTCNELLKNAIKKNPSNPINTLSSGLPLEITPPLQGDCWIKFTGTIKDDQCLIHEILEIDGFPALPYENIKYIHSSFKKKVINDKGKPQKQGFPVKSQSGFKQDSARGKVKTNKNQPIAKVPETVFGFSKLPKLERKSLNSSVLMSEKKSESSEQIQRTGTSTFNNKIKNQVFSVDESYTGGNANPIEFSGLKLRLSTDHTGLIDFFKILDRVAILNPKLSIIRKVYNLPGDLSFCFYEEKKRNIAVIYICQDKVQPVYLIEVARPDRWAVSTMLLQFSSKIKSQEKVNQILLSTINDMIENGGHWQMEKIRQLSNISSIRVRHFKDDPPETRAVGILQKLWILGLK